MSAPAFTEDELRRQAQGNAMATLLTTIAFLKRGGGSVTDWTRFVAEQFAPSWREAAEWDAMQLARAWALNWVSVGARAESVEGDARRAEVVVTNWPADQDLKELDLTRDDIDQFIGICVPLTESVGAHIAWSREGDRISMTITR
ncbi:MAG TPA: hypothetical protein VF812_09525 [Ktedonobacterales bacterium]